jgi:hypothetical protein
MSEPSDNEQDKRKGWLAKVGNLSVTAAAVLGSKWLVLIHPELTIPAASLEASAPLLGAAAEGAIQKAQGLVAGLNTVKILRANQTLETAAERILEEGLNPNAETLRDTVVAAFDVAAEAETKEKRELIENLIVNAARRNDDAARTEALEALEAIRKMPAIAAAVFGHVSREVSTDGHSTLRRSQDYHNLPYVLVWPTVVMYLGQQNQLVTNNEVGGDTVHLGLHPNGQWLADWVKRNPSPKADEGPTDGAGDKPA